MNVQHSPLLVGAPGTNGACPLIASGDGNAATHMAVYIDEKGEYVETPITLPLTAFPMAPLVHPPFLPANPTPTPNANTSGSGNGNSPENNGDAAETQTPGDAQTA